MNLSLKKMMIAFGISVLALAACSPEAERQTAKGINNQDKIEEDNNTQIFDPTVDILFVIDNSGSMQTHQRNLANNVSLFTSTFTKGSVLDYNIGVVSTDMDGPGGDCCGKLVGGIRVVTKATPNADQVLAGNILLGINGSGYEKVFDPVMAALSAPLVTGWNNGFYRQNANLAVIFITDAEDQSRSDASSFYNFLVNLKGGNKDKVLGYGVIIPKADTFNCMRDAYEDPDKIEEFLKMVKNAKAGTNVMNLCAPDYGKQLADLAKDIVEEVGNTIYLNRVPDVSTIRVTFGAVDLPQDASKGWSFDPAKNAIILGSKIDWTVQPSGSRVKVYYSAANIED